MPVTSMRNVIFVLFVLCLGVAIAQPDASTVTVPTCKFSASILNLSSETSSTSPLPFESLKSHLKTRFHNTSIVALELSFPCRAILPSHCCKIQASVRPGVLSDLDALESVRAHPVFAVLQAPRHARQVFVLSAPKWSATLNSISPKYIMDGGAGPGYATLLLASLFPSARIISVEASRSNFALLRANTAALQNVHPVRAMLWNKQVMLQSIRGDAHEQSFAFQELPYSEPTVGPLPFLRQLSYAAPIPHLLRLFGFPTVDLVKLDLEGAEARVLSHTAPLNWLKDAQAVLVQLHDHAAPVLGVQQVSGPVVDLMRTKGYSVNHTGEFTLFMKSEEHSTPVMLATQAPRPSEGEDAEISQAPVMMHNGMPVAADDTNVVV